MAEPLVSELLEQLREAERTVRQEAGVNEELGKLTSNLDAMNDVLEDAKRRQVKEATVRQWLHKFKDVSYDIDDMLDEWNTAIMKMQIKGDDNAPMPKRTEQVALRHDIVIKIKELNARLDIIANEKREEVHVRDQDKNAIVQTLLLSEGSQGPAFRIISIVGMGGIGKTTLAQLVYNDDTVKAHFQIRIWVCVSDPFDEIRIAKEILQSLLGSAPNFNELHSLLRQISNSMKGKKFLLVLDDVWTEDYKRFEKLKSSLRSGSLGSKILVTTRKETVANTMGTLHMFRLGQLSNEDCWSLFSHVAFFGRSNDEREYLKEIGQKIANKCKGLPLAAKVLGSLLHSKKTREEWESVLDSDVWKLEEVERGVFPTLLLSYYDLNPIMRRCFSYCAIFPKNYIIRRDSLIKLWMAQGYFRETHSPELIGEKYFNNLVMRSFFQDFEKDEDGRIITCKMHDIMHDLAQYLTKNECFVMEVYNPEELRFDSSHEKARHSMMLLTKTVPIPAFVYNVKNLRSLIVESKDLPMINVALPKLFDQLTCLRTLNLSRPGSSLNELPSEVGKLIHLRYLNLAYNDKLEKLPEEVSDLYNLQSLILYRCSSLKELPRGLGNLINLRHLQLLGTRRLEFMPRGMYRLISLRTLDKFVVSSDSNVNEASTLKDLWNLYHFNILRGYLEITELGKVRDVSEARTAVLYNNLHLLGLCLHFGEGEGEEMMTNDEKVIEALEPPPNLEQLAIDKYRGTVLPNWRMSSLRDLTIWGCPKLKVLPDDLLQTKSLKKLEISSCPILRERYKARIGEDWHKISHIPNIRLNWIYVQKNGVLMSWVKDVFRDD